MKKRGSENDELEVPFSSIPVQVPSSSFSVQNETVSAHGTHRGAREVPSSSFSVQVPSSSSSVQDKTFSAHDTSSWSKGSIMMKPKIK